MTGSHEATMLLEAMAGGDQGAAQRLLPLIYEELRALAGSYFRRQPANHTLQPTALVHDAYLRLIDQTGSPWKNRAHFMAVAATAMKWSRPDQPLSLATIFTKASCTSAVGWSVCPPPPRARYRPASRRSSL